MGIAASVAASGTAGHNRDNVTQGVAHLELPETSSRAHDTQTAPKACDKTSFSIPNVLHVSAEAGRNRKAMARRDMIATHFIRPDAVSTGPAASDEHFLPDSQCAARRGYSPTLGRVFPCPTIPYEACAHGKQRCSVSPENIASTSPAHQIDDIVHASGDGEEMARHTHPITAGSQDTKRKSYTSARASACMRITRSLSPPAIGRRTKGVRN